MVLASSPAVLTDTVSEEELLPEVAESLNQLPPDEVLTVATQSRAIPLLEIVSCWGAALPALAVNVIVEVPRTKFRGAVTANETVNIRGVAPLAESVMVAL